MRTVAVMRNLFDQYEQPENRLTHALVSCLNEDHKLLHLFVQWVTGHRTAKRRPLAIVEQTLPGEDDLTEQESEARGLPDAWIHDNEDWALIIECKVKSSVNPAQLRRHHATALRRGFEQLDLLVLAAEAVPKRSLAGWSHKTWPQVYAWFVGQSNQSEWAQRMVRYMEVAEARLIGSGYLDKGALTMFSGIHFDDDNPYSYQEAKRCLRLAMKELRKNKRLLRFGIDPEAAGRPAITGKGESEVWDFLRLKESNGASLFTQYPHYTLAIVRDHLLTITVFANDLKPEFRRNLTKHGEDGFNQLVLQVGAALSKLLRKAEGAKPWMEVVQRHYRNRRSVPTTDARLGFDLRTSIPRKGRKKADAIVKSQTQWLDTTYDVFANKHSNFLIAIGSWIPYTSKVLRSREALEYIAGTWLACEPMVRAALGSRFGRG